MGLLRLGALRPAPQPPQDPVVKYIAAARPGVFKAQPMGIGVFTVKLDKVGLKADPSKVRLAVCGASPDEATATACDLYLLHIIDCLANPCEWSRHSRWQEQEVCWFGVADQGAPKARARMATFKGLCRKVFGRDFEPERDGGGFWFNPKVLVRLFFLDGRGYGKLSAFDVEDLGRLLDMAQRQFPETTLL